MKASDVAKLLPDVFRRALPGDEVLAGILEVMEDHHAPVERLLSELDAVFDPRRTPDVLVPMLARWVDLERIYALDSRERHIAEDITIPRLRELVFNSHTLSQLRGTATGLITFLELATGVRGFTIDEPAGDGDQGAFHLRVHVPSAADGQLALVQRIVESEKPAYATWETVLDA